MTITRYISPAFATRWHDDIKPSLFQMSKDLGNVQTITFHRDATDGSDVAIGPYEVLVDTGGRIGVGFGSPVVGADGAVSYVGVTGWLRKAAPFSVLRKDRFCLNTGPCGSITSDPLDNGTFISAPFVIER